MEESEQILVNSLKNGDVSIPADVSSVKHLTSSTLVSICGQSLNLIFNTTSFGTSLPDSMADKFKICTELSSAIQNLGYIGDINYYKFLYPSEEDLYKLIRFLVERLSEFPKGVKGGDVKDVSDRRKVIEEKLETMIEDDEEKKLQKVGEELSESRLEDVLLHSANSEDVASDNGNDRTVESVGANPTEEQSLEIIIEAENLQNDYQKRKWDVNAKTSELMILKKGKLLIAAAKMAFHDSHPTKFDSEQLDEQMGDRKCHLVELEPQWNAFEKSLEEKKKNLQDNLYANEPEAQEKLQMWREVELQRQSILSEIQKRDDEYSELSADLEKQPKVASRRSYIERIKEITKNSRKVDADIERILKETRELQLESNSIQEGLHRTYAVADDMIFKEAKKDRVGQQAYRLLTSIDDSFEQVAEKILATDRVRRDIAEYEKKLAAMATRSLNADKLQADLDAIVKENEFLEQQRHGES